jgi:Transposase DDE domain
MFLRVKRTQGYAYVQLVENRWREGQPRQRVLATLGRLEQLQESGGLEALLESGSRLVEGLTVLSEYRRGEAPAVRAQRIGAPLVFGRLWEEIGCRAVVSKLLADRRFEFAVERAIFLEVLHRLVHPGSDLAGADWRQDYQIPGVDGLELHHAYRAMAWLGEAVEGADPPRAVKDLIEERLFARRRDLFSSLELVFFDTTSIYFEGEGGESLGRYGHSKDHRPDRKQMVVGVVLDQEGVPLCCEILPGNATDVTLLLPVAERLSRRFGVERVTLVADRGMIGSKTIEQLETAGWGYILGARMRSQNEVRQEVLSRAGRYQVVGPGSHQGPATLKVKDVRVEGRRYVVCLNEDQATKDAADRTAMVTALEDRLHSGAAALIGNSGYRRYLKVTRGSVAIDATKVAAEARFDGKWVLRTNLMDLEAADIAVAYKQLWMVEDVFRTMKSVLETRPVYHRCDDTIRGHVFCSFLALRLRTELEDRLAARGQTDLPWGQVIRDLDRLQEIEISKNKTRFLLRTEVTATAGKVFQAAGVALPPTIRRAA